MDTFPVPIHPSQLHSFKNSATAFAKQIATLSETKPLSAFKRNDYLSLGVGYNGHTTLIAASKFRADADNDEPLLLFSVDVIKAAIVEVFAVKMPSIPRHLIEQAADTMSEAELPLNNTKPRLYWDELSTQPYDAGFLDRINSVLVTTNEMPVVKVNLADVPLHIATPLMAHPVFKNIVIERNDICLKLSPPAYTNNANWKIGVSFDTWGVSEVPMDFMLDWYAFRDWLLLFNVTGCVQVSERIHDHRMTTYVHQAHPATELTDITEKLPTDEDRSLLQLLLNPNDS